ncbi:hypothetical protein UNSWDHB_652 [Dehalobacter sp. UNSWDHB]|uniref:carbohydrate kinase family protein n=1 Tax=Dehalobacter sp. UNSWDHB TaxID=1339256 RepID=UPI00038778C3|nr:PfkB family carbohydrate kinase [Dehalobacter sp. UNSWDHB]EQB22038.1 hypothetical protein UNSWDHB_652 [Dehalobacter sp. UNSWDHB]
MVQHNLYSNENNVPNVLGAGLLCLDIIKNIENTKYLNGGSCGNVVSALSFLGWRSSIITNQYKDPAGDILNQNLERLRVRRIEVGRPIQTPRIVQEVINSDHRYLLSCPDCGRKLPSIEPLTEKTVENIAESSNHYNVYYTDRTSRGIEFLRNILRNRGTWTVYEPNSSRNINSLLRSSLESHIVKFSGEKVSQSLADKIREIAINGSTTLIVRTMGKDGVLFCYRKRDNKMSKWFQLESQPVTDFVDSSGAGDWCTTGLLFNLVNRHRKSKLWLTRDEVVAALQYGQALSAISCSFSGALGLIYSDNGEKIQTIVNEDTQFRLSGLKPSLPPKKLSDEYCKTCLLPFEH